MSTTEASRAWEYLRRNPAYIEAWRGLFGGAALLPAAPADLEAGLGWTLAAPRTQAARDARGVAPPLVSVDPLAGGVLARRDRRHRSARVAEGEKP